LELIGIPHRITVGDRGLKQGQLEYQARREGKAQMIPVEQAVAFVKSLCA
jgi:prolyl-tRNA synthetase